VHVVLGQSSFEVKIEADSNDIIERPHDDKPSIGMFSFLMQSLFLFVFFYFPDFYAVNCTLGMQSVIHYIVSLLQFFSAMISVNMLHIMISISMLLVLYSLQSITLCGCCLVTFVLSH